MEKGVQLVKYNLWKNTLDVITWFGDIHPPPLLQKIKHIFTYIHCISHILCDFCPSDTKEKALDFTSHYIEITIYERMIIKHIKRSLSEAIT